MPSLPRNWHGVYHCQHHSCSSFDECASYRCAALDMESSHGIPVVHGVEGGHLVYSHRWHFQDSRHLIHDTDACEAMLALTQVQQGHDSGLLVLARVSRKDFFDELLILGVEFKGNRRVVLRCVAMLQRFWLGACEHAAARRTITYHLKGCAARGAGDLERPLLLVERRAQRSRAASKRPRRDLGGHCDVRLRVWCSREVARTSKCPLNAPCRQRITERQMSRGPCTMTSPSSSFRLRDCSNITISHAILPRVFKISQKHSPVVMAVSSLLGASFRPIAMALHQTMCRLATSRKA